MPADESPAPAHGKKITFACEFCGKMVTDYVFRHLSTRKHCSRSCAAFDRWDQGTFIGRKGKGNPSKYQNIPNFKCYQREARAILTGRHWEGKNRCTKLRGDEDG